MATITKTWHDETAFVSNFQDLSFSTDFGGKLTINARGDKNNTHFTLSIIVNGEYKSTNNFNLKDGETHTIEYNMTENGTLNITGSIKGALFSLPTYSGNIEATLTTPNLTFNNWMTNDPFIQNSTLKQITLPGAHDAGMGKITSCTEDSTSTITKTQAYSFKQMLDAGVRYFDVRPVIKENDTNDTFYLGHYTWIGDYSEEKPKDIAYTIKQGILGKKNLKNQGCTGYSLEKVLDDVNNFILENEDNKELIILKISHAMDLKDDNVDHSGLNTNKTQNLVEKIKEKLENHFFISDSKDPNNPDIINTPIKEMTKNGTKVIITLENYNITPMQGIYTQDSLDLFDSYSDINNFDVMKNDQFKKMSENADSSYFLLSWTLSQSYEEIILNAKLSQFEKKYPILKGVISNIRKSNYRKVNVQPVIDMINDNKDIEQDTKSVIIQILTDISQGQNLYTIEDLANKANSHLDDILNEVKSTKKYPNIIYTDFINSNMTKLSMEINQLRKGK